jgi:hypothetical protein
MSNLDKIDFGIGAAQLERHLRDFFYRSTSFDLACSEKTYLILGPKGAGKSAIFQMLGELQNEIKTFRKPNLWVGDEPQLRDHWNTIHAVTESKVALWRFYLASLIAERLLEEDTLPDNLQKLYRRFLVRWGLVREVPTRWQALRTMKVKVGFGDYLSTELPLKSPLGATECDQVIYTAEEWLSSRNADLWLCLDSLDEVKLNGGTSDELEDLLGNLMRAVGELIRLKRIRFKLFFRSDIYQALTYVNKDHFSAVKLELKWTKEDIAILLAHRLAVLHPENKAAITYPLALQWLNEVFDWSKRYHHGFEGLHELFKDGNGDVLPRDFVNFCIEAQKLQQTFAKQGINEVTEQLISAAAVEEAMQRTAASKLSDFLQVFENFGETFKQLKGHKSSQFTRKQLSEALGKKDLDAQLVISELVRIGAIAVKDYLAVNRSDRFEIPPLYAIALNIGGKNE